MEISNICQLEIPVSDLETAKDFYLNVFRWEPIDIELHEYVVLDIPRSLPYGISLVRSKNTRSGGPVVFFQCSDLQTLKERVIRAKGKVVKERLIPGYGKALLIEDPFRNQFGLFEKKDSAL